VPSLPTHPIAPTHSPHLKFRNCPVTVLLPPDPTTATYRAGLWQIAYGRVTDSSGTQSALGMVGCADLVQKGLAAVLAAATDAIIDALILFADATAVNPACLAETILAAPVFDGWPAPSRFLAVAAHQALAAADPTGESGSPHETCHPWPPSTIAPSLATASDGVIFATAISAAQQFPDLVHQPALALTMAAPEVLTQLTWARLDGDPDRFVATLAEHAGLSA